MISLCKLMVALFILSRPLLHVLSAFSFIVLDIYHKYKKLVEFFTLSRRRHCCRYTDIGTLTVPTYGLTRWPPPRGPIVGRAPRWFNCTDRDNYETHPWFINNCFEKLFWCSFSYYQLSTCPAALTFYCVCLCCR